MIDASILDPCCGGRMMWFDRQDQRALFGDIRSEEHTLCDGRAFNITPDLNMDFRSMPFPDESFRLVAFDPPHLRHAGRDSWLRAKYGILGDDWQEDLRRGFSECFRVLKPEGVLVFKWNAIQIRTPQILALTPHKPLFGHPSGKRADTHWLTFMKPPRPKHHNDTLRAQQIDRPRAMRACANAVALLDEFKRER